MKKKVIAVVPLWDEEKNSLWMLPDYLDALRESGGIPLVLPLHVDGKDALEILGRCDGLLITGGHDVSPAMYGQEKKPACGPLCQARDALETVLYTQAVAWDMPVLGICRGMQTMNVLEGGTLYQDLPTEKPSKVPHRVDQPSGPIMHYVNLQSALQELLGIGRLGVNSFHHQAVCRLGENLEVMALADDGIIEAVRHKDKKFVWAVQWHPERSFCKDENSRKLFEAFLQAC